MSSQSEVEICVFCKQGWMIKQNQKIAFRQRTNKGYVFCRVSIQVNICTQCGARSTDDSAQAIMDEAVSHEYDKLP